MKRVAVLVSGRGSNMHALLKGQQGGKLPNASIVLVLTNNPEARALGIAKEFGVETVVLDSKPYKGRREDYDREVVEILRSKKIDIVCLAGFMRILSPVLIRAFKNKILNIHPALLPAFPGLHGQKQALDYGVKVSGCTVHFVDEGVDTGPVILQKAVAVLNDDDEDSLSERILEQEHKIYAEALDLVSRDLVEVKGRRVYIKEQ
jgi:phosphoribosylglycinamide formyltransferase-1